MTKLKKPTKKKAKPYWDYNEVVHYLEALHGKNFRDYAGKFDPKNLGAYNNDDKVPYQDFWHWMMDSNDAVTNGSWVHLPDWEYYATHTVEPWKKEIMQYFKDFLKDDYDERLWVEW